MHENARISMPLTSERVIVRRSLTLVKQAKSTKYAPPEVIEVKVKELRCLKNHLIVSLRYIDVIELINMTSVFYATDIVTVVCKLVYSE